MNPNNMDLSIYACGHYSQSNIATGGTTCPTGFEAIPLFTTKHMLSEVTEYQDADCSRFYGLFTCDDSWWQTIHNVRVKLTASFCRSPKENSAANANRVLVGGYYHEHVHNLVTGHFGCPPGFQAHIVATSVKLCLGKGTINDPERYPRFGGIFSCQSAMDQRKCIRGFSPHVIATIDNCDLTICLRGNRTEVHHIQPPIRPPFLDDKGPSVPQSQHDIPDSIVQGFVGENKWLEMPLKTIAAKVDRSQSNTGKLVKEKLKSWITDELEHVISLIQKVCRHKVHEARS